MNIKDVKRISIIGGAGCGKTSLSCELGKELGIKPIHIDGINFKKNWVERDLEERDRIIFDKMKGDSWIFDGTYRSTLLDRMKESDLIIYLDYSTGTQVRSVINRYLKTRGKEKDDIPGCREKMDLDFFKYVVNFRRVSRPHIIERLKLIDSNKVLIFKNRKELYKWYRDTFNKKYKYER